MDANEHLVECWVEEQTPGARVQTPWGVITLGDDAGGGQVVEVEAVAAFDLVLHGRTTSYFEHVEPGRHLLLLTVLDRTDVMRS